MWECDKAKKNVVGNREWEEKDDRNSHGFWGGVQIMMLSPWMFCAHTQRERERERERYAWTVLLDNQGKWANVLDGPPPSLLINYFNISHTNRIFKT